MSLVDELNQALDVVRSIPGLLGLRPFTATIRVRSWSGPRPGLGTVSDTDTILQVNGQSPEVRQLTQRDVIASGGLYTTQDLEITLTPAFSTAVLTGGLSVLSLDPATTSHPQEIFFKVTGPGYPSGAWFKKIGQNFSEALTYKITLRKTAEVV